LLWIGMQYELHCDQFHNQSTQVRAWAHLARDMDPK
jgi:hypothetical protein